MAASAPNVSHTRPEYDALAPRWELIRDCLGGSERVKAARTAYLPMPNSADTSAENQARYQHYLDRAVFYNVTGRTLAGLAGQVFRKDPDVALPAVLRMMIDDVDGSGVGLWQQSKRVLSDVLAYGRSGLFVDYPDTGGTAASRAQIASGLIRPAVIRYDPWDIINWRMRKIGGVHRLSLVVLAEQYVTDDDGFEEEMDYLWRVLRLDEDNLYVVDEYINEGTGLEPNYVLRSSAYPTDFSGARLNFVPFVFCGSVNNDPQPDLPPLYDLAELNIAHYRNSADYEESVFMVGQPTPYFSGLTQDWVDNVFKGKVQLGSRAAVPLPENGSAGLLQVSPNSLPSEAMRHKEEQMIALGAKLIEVSKVERTATEVVIKDFGEHANLTTVSKNVSEAYRGALAYARRFVSGDNSEIRFRLSTDFEVGRLDANEQAQLVALWQSGAIVESELRSVLLQNGIAKLDYETFKTTRESEGPPDWAMGVPAGADQNLGGER